MLRYLFLRVRRKPCLSRCKWISTHIRAQPSREMLSLKTVLGNLLHNSRRALIHTRRPVLQLKNTTRPYTNKLSQGQTDRRLVRDLGLQQSSNGGVVRQLFHNILRRLTRPGWDAFSTQENFRRLLGNASPYFALVGVSLAIPPESASQSSPYELEAVCGDIREAVSRSGWLHDPSFWKVSKKQKDSLQNISINDFELGHVVGKGCNAVVYAAREALVEDTPLVAATPPRTNLMPTGDNLSVPKRPSRMQSLFKGSFNRKRKIPPTDAPSDLIDETLKEYPLAIKMMFNYDAESNFSAIFRAMHKEVLPANYLQISQGFMEWKKRLGNEDKLAPHANIVNMPCAFVDMVPNLAEGASLYPNALPKRLHTEGYGRNMSMFLVMKRYDCTLGEYLSKQNPDSRTSISLLAQLLEAVLHLTTFGIAHRDLKMDNILLSLSEGLNYPKLVVTDFGCCFCDQSAQLSVPFTSYESDPRQGNAALMPPEIKNAVPGLLRNLSYSKNDLWASGALAYEMFGLPNPFYSENGAPALDSATYQHSELPKLPKNIPTSVRRLIKALLHPNPSNRPDAGIASTICQLQLWAPPKWSSVSSSVPSPKEITRWLLCLSTKVICESGGRGEENTAGAYLEYEIVSTFLSRIHYSDLFQSLHWIRSH